MKVNGSDTGYYVAITQADADPFRKKTDFSANHIKWH